jgi:putative SOS response-associated peptidase YedK
VHCSWLDRAKDVRWIDRYRFWAARSRRLFLQVSLDVRSHRTDGFDGIENLLLPDGMAPVVRRNSEGERELRLMRWGFPHAEPEPGEKPRSGYVTNVRNPRIPHRALP